MKNALHYYAGNHTAKGFYPLYASNFLGLDHVVFLKGNSKSLKTSLIEQLALKWSKAGYDVEVIHSYDENYLEGVIVPQLSYGIYGGPDNVFKGENTNLETIHVDSVIPNSLLEKYDHSIPRYQRKVGKLLASAHHSFQTGLRIHDDLEDIYIDHMDFGKADEEADKLAKDIFYNVEKKDRESIYKHRFFGASTPTGVVDYIPNLTEGLKKRYFIKGRAGTGKSTFMKRIITAAEQLGLDMEVYHCGFDPDSLDMVIFRELNVCIFDSTDPHEYFPERDGDQVIDLYDVAVMPGTDEKYEKEITLLTRRYKSYMKKGIEYLKETQRLNKKLEQLYTREVNTSAFDSLIADLQAQLNVHGRTPEQ